MPSDAHSISDLILSLVPEFMPQPNEVFLDSIAPHVLRAAIEDKSLQYRLAEQEGRIIGVCGIQNESHLYHLFVATSLKGAGLGFHLFKDACQRIKDAGFNRMTLNASENAIAFYERQGCKATDEMQDKNGVRFLPMALTLI